MGNGNSNLRGLGQPQSPQPVDDEDQQLPNQDQQPLEPDQQEDIADDWEKVQVNPEQDPGDEEPRQQQNEESRPQQDQELQQSEDPNGTFPAARDVKPTNLKKRDEDEDNTPAPATATATPDGTDDATEESDGSKESSSSPDGSPLRKRSRHDEPEHGEIDELLPLDQQAGPPENASPSAAANHEDPQPGPAPPPSPEPERAHAPEAHRNRPLQRQPAPQPKWNGHRHNWQSIPNPTKRNIWCKGPNCSGLHTRHDDPELKEEAHDPWHSCMKCPLTYVCTKCKDTVDRLTTAGASQRREWLCPIESRAERGNLTKAMEGAGLKRKREE